MTSENAIRHAPIREVNPIRLIEQLDAVFDTMGSTMPDAYSRITDDILLTFQHSSNDKIRELSDHVSKLIDEHRFNVMVKPDDIITGRINDEALCHFREDLTALIDRFDLADEDLVATDATPA